MTVQWCEKCAQQTEHKEVMKQKPSQYGKSRKEQFKAFLSGFFTGVAVGGALASLELVDRYVVCQKCGHKKLENHGEEFQ
ncbi:hypothetical protein L1D54_03495 [Vibrio brasiliensis]|jgi:DNA-directed RNA polymerase subunit RPC12/RpoP|uniref:LITAF domain-containing protein n=1 Tax=Vibrio brasiliensis LMG 20546 TaxID=945543 RepID=E8LWZ8_9VIBR|nr:hypothetical protein [Vibrio brasiliensis]EGA64899.1 hypothetical protein VIBR0546_17753 [Vibrio brasiliensis LMG 20546]MCG9649332.1 hypothetical protein [Vibrio brasiliensis]MCG9725144.1 hypothetical protein [Vibrio brasiliensis]MCG9749531.1 hypothetical protein [Vibrio brasiliensis]MCG9782594.1 hypothetical protein [Vibrio brasiliensis]|tara:strand:- start:290 stop:529 length:240 start_codon:yes stop_codon:yes gene_type:complete